MLNTAQRFTNSAPAGELISFHAQQTADAKAHAAEVLKASVRNAGITYMATTLAEDGSDDLADALHAIKNGNLGIAEGLISSVLDALRAMQKEINAS